ncbi:MAG: siderophore staphylobactin biosynthesis protein SbnC, partial [Actinomycetota bacterium]|nr:siderophore staphylobactin biosynthesis protein SbnC [Actinomycetota bacterium]
MIRAGRHDPSELVMRDLVDTLIQENLWGFADGAQQCRPAALVAETLKPDEQWCRIDVAGGWVCFRTRATGALQPCRFSRPPVWHGGSSGLQPRQLRPDELLALLASGCSDLPQALQGGADLRTAVQHAAVVLAGRARLTDASPRSGGLLTAERLAATRNRPFHPTARAAIGWTEGELARYGPLR